MTSSDANPDRYLAHQHEIALHLDRVRDLEAQAAVDRNEIKHLHTALGTARRIGAALGVIMAALKVTEETAFEMLKAASQTSNRKLRDIADELVTTGVVPLTRSRDGRPDHPATAVAQARAAARRAAEYAERASVYLAEASQKPIRHPDQAGVEPVGDEPE